MDRVEIDAYAKELKFDISESENLGVTVVTVRQTFGIVHLIRH